MAADEGLGALLLQQAPTLCLPLLKANLPLQGTVNTPACQPTPLIQVHSWLPVQSTLSHAIA